MKLLNLDDVTTKRYEFKWSDGNTSGYGHVHAVNKKDAKIIICDYYYKKYTDLHGHNLNIRPYLKKINKISNWNFEREWDKYSCRVYAILGAYISETRITINFWRLKFNWSLKSEHNLIN